MPCGGAASCGATDLSAKDAKEQEAMRQSQPTAPPSAAGPGPVDSPPNYDSLNF